MHTIHIYVCILYVCMPVWICVCVCTHTHTTIYVSIYRTFCKVCVKLKDVIIWVFPVKKKMQYHHFMPVYQPLHRYEHFNVSLCQTVRCQFQWSTLTNTPTSGTGHSFVPPLLLPVNDSQFSSKVCLAHGYAAVFVSLSVVFVSWSSLGEMPYKDIYW